jgi:DNA polymerase III epsilon subunit family exonuclease
MHLDDAEITIFDTETTGLDPEAGDRIVEIAAIRLKKDAEVSRFSSLVDPGCKISEAAFNVNHISADMLKGAPKMRQILPDFFSFIKGSCLCSYNAAFDLGFLSNEARLSTQALPEGLMVVDILKMARRLLPTLERYALWFVAERLGIKKAQDHRALSDVELTLSVFRRLKEILFLKGILDYQSFCQLFAISGGLLQDLDSQKISRIQEAIDLGVKIKIRYLSSSGAEVSEREVVPKELKQENSRSYLVGYCCLRQDERTFRIDNILSLEISK